MRKVIVSTYVTLDGVMDDPTAWSLDYFDDEAGKYATELLFGSGGLLLGRNTYESFVAAWPSRAGDPFADKINGMPKYVASTTLEELDWENATLIEGDVPDAVAKLKEEPGQDLLIYGCRELMHSLLERDLIDEYRIWVHPVVVGSGRRLFKDGVDGFKLTLTDTKVLPSGVAIHTYESATTGNPA